MCSKKKTRKWKKFEKWKKKEKKIEKIIFTHCKKKSFKKSIS